MLSPDPIDVHVGHIIRAKRLAIGLTLEELGRCLGVSYQQVQKYEKGTNRVSVSTLYRMAWVLGIAPDAFFRDLSTYVHLPNGR
ncbi:helix-turn-helix domain-containing protein [Aureimonas sp. AU4]|uniref:helix-turn-helix domain-containing protein n=1 Tax=Aureimonas sp. AU4 TaxID=1638163 RepID=UPI0007068856|nr:helix-turn-helix transcriptional regulator [Aureimonas sp. AU4]BAT30589.1 transcriptional regulator, XRE family [Aureimonas sp. AU4]